MRAAFLPGELPAQAGLLQRYLPPLPRGAAAAWLAERQPPDTWALDPFGASPAVAVEMARAGYRVLAAVNNPIARFLIELYAEPPTQAELRAALADLAASQKGGERIEPLIRGLYLTDCAQCGRQIEAQAFIWERETAIPTARLYTCPYCKDSGERPFAPHDPGQLVRTGSGGLHRARALERIASLNDPDRQYAEEALAVYPGRAVYALFTLINHLDMLTPARRQRASALLLYAFDQASGLWHYPLGRTRPRQLSLPGRYLEKNVWLALEEAVENWGALTPGLAAGAAPVRLAHWPEALDEPGVCLFEGRLKDLAFQLHRARQPIQLQSVVAALPRPNQAYWTLCALWAGWLWGQAASAPFKSVLRRRRYDWNWHVEALSSAFNALAPIIEPDTPLFGLIGEAEPGFLSAALIAGETAGLDLLGVALRSAQEQAQIEWQRRGEPVRRHWEDEARRSEAGRKMLEFLKNRGEPADFLHLHTAGLEALVQSHALPAGEVTPAEMLRVAEAAIGSEMRQSQKLLRFGGGTRSLEVGQWWLNERGVPLSEIAAPLADRVEIALVRRLTSQPRVSMDELERALCQEFTGLFTPGRALIQGCLESYAEPAEPGSAEYRLRPQDAPAARRQELQQMRTLLSELGERLGSLPPAPAAPGEDPAPVVWAFADEPTRYRFYLSASAVLGRIVFGEPTRRSAQAGFEKRLIVLPGGRAGLVEYKLRRDPRLRKAIEEDWGFVKFRQARWLAENESLRRQNLEELLELDPLSNRDPQLPLL